MPETKLEKAAAEELAAQLAARLWFALQTEQLYQLSNQWAREYQDILLSLDIERNLRARAIKLTNAAVTIATGAFMAAGSVVANGLIRGVGPLAQRLLPATALRANMAAQAARLAAAEATVVARHTMQMAAVNVGKQLCTPMWVIREFQVMPAFVLGQLAREFPLRFCFGMLSSIPVMLTNNYVSQKMGDTRPSPLGGATTLWRLWKRDDLDKHDLAKLQRAEKIIAGYLSGLTATQNAMMIMSPEQLSLTMAHLDADLSAQLRDSPKLREEKADEKTILFLRAQLLMEYWLGVQQWVEPMRLHATLELRQLMRQCR